jgi:Siphovirus ReqiPepy6 Gp37-like protein
MPHLTPDGEALWAVNVRDIDLQEIETCKGYEKLRMNLLNNAVGDFSLSLPDNHVAYDALTAEGAGIVARPLGHSDVTMSGFVTDVYVTENRDSEVGGVTVVGLTDDILLAGEVGYPNTAVDVPTGSTTTFGVENDSETGPAETVLKAFVANNIGPAAGITRRRYPFLNIPATTGLGTSGTWTSRFDNLLTLCQQIAINGGLSFRVAQSAPGELTLYVWEPTFNVEARFSVNAGNLTSAVMSLRAPNQTDVIVGGDGEGTARIFTRRETAGLEATYGRRMSKFMSRQSITDYAELQQELDVELQEGLPEGGITLYPVELPSLRYGVHYRLGDEVSAIVRGIELIQPVRRVVIEYEPGRSVDVIPTVGLPIGDGEMPEDAPIVRDMIRNVNSGMRN